MAKRTIEQIKIGKFPANTAFGAYVYNFNIQLGANGEATVIEIDLINESGLYNISPKDLNGTSPFSIIVGGSKTTGFFIKSAFLVSYDTSRVFQYAKMCVDSPNYPKISTSQTLNIINLFQNFLVRGR